MRLLYADAFAVWGLLVPK